MKIDLPHVEHTIRVVVNTPEGNCIKTLDSSHQSFEIELPDDVHEDEVEVLAVNLDECGLAVGEMQYLKEAVTPEPEDEDEYDEDVPCEADEEVAQSPPDEVADEQADEEEEVELKDMGVDDYGEDDHFDGGYALG